jgi:hypothetical protein
MDMILNVSPKYLKESRGRPMRLASVIRLESLQNDEESEEWLSVSNSESSDVVALRSEKCGGLYVLRNWTGPPPSRIDMQAASRPRGQQTFVIENKEDDDAASETATT